MTYSHHRCLYLRCCRPINQTPLPADRVSRVRLCVCALIIPITSSNAYSFYPMLYFVDCSILILLSMISLTESQTDSSISSRTTSVGQSTPGHTASRPYVSTTTTANHENSCPSYDLPDDTCRSVYSDNLLLLDIDDEGNYSQLLCDCMDFTSVLNKYDCKPKEEDEILQLRTYSRDVTCATCKVSLQLLLVQQICCCPPHRVIKCVRCFVFIEIVTPAIADLTSFFVTELVYEGVESVK